MFSLVLAIVTSAAIAIILKVNESRSGDRLVMSGANYVVAAILGLLFPQQSSDGATWGVIGMGIAVGAGFVGGFVLLMLGINRLGLAIPASVSRLSMLLPTAASLLLFDERPDAATLLGIATGAAAFLLLGASQRGTSQRGASRPDARGHEAREKSVQHEAMRRGESSRERADDTALDLRSIGLIAAIFVVSGCTDFSLKVAQQTGLARGPFLAVVFATSALICWIVALAGRRRIDPADVKLGAILGAPNFFSGYFVLLALRDLPASVVFPAVSAGVVVTVTLTAVIVWRERLRGVAWAGIALAAVAVILLGMR